MSAKTISALLALFLLISVVAAGSTCCGGGTSSGCAFCNDSSYYLFVNGSRPMTGNLSINTFAINGIVNISELSDAVNVSWVRNLVWNNASIATTANLSITNATLKAYVDWNQSVTNATLYQLILNNLTDYAYKPGLRGGQSLNGGTEDTDYLYINATAYGAKGHSWLVLQPIGGGVVVGTSSSLVANPNASHLKVYGKISTTKGDTAGNAYELLSTTVGYNASNNYGWIQVGGPSSGIGTNLALQRQGGNVTIGALNSGTSQLHTTDTVRFAKFTEGTTIFDNGGNITSSFSKQNQTYLNITGIKGVNEASDAVNLSYAQNLAWNNASFSINTTYATTANLSITNATMKSYVDTYRVTSRTRPVIIESDFLDASTDAIPGLLGAVISSGTTAGVATDANHPGVIYLRDSTTLGGGYRFGCSGSNLIAGGETFETIFQTVGVRQLQASRMGWSDSTAVATLPTDGIWINVSAPGGVITLSGVTSSNSVRSETATYAAAASTWYRGLIFVNPAANLVNFYLYSDAGALLWSPTLAANIPTGAGRDTSPCIIAGEGSTDAAANVLIMDYAKWDVNRTVTRG